MARERYLLDVGEDTIHTGVIELKTKKDKAKNWWYYNKRILLFVAIAAAVAFSWIYSVVTKVDPDYTVGMVTSFSLPSEVTEELERYLEPFCEDRNGDGKVKVVVSSYVFGDFSTSQDYQLYQAAYTRFAGDAAIGGCMIYIHDEDGLRTLGDGAQGFFVYNDGTPMPDGAVDFENASRPWSEFAGLSDFTAQGNELNNWTPEVVQELCKRLSVSVRTPEGMVEKDEKLKSYYQDSVKLLERLEKGERLRPESDPE